MKKMLSEISNKVKGYYLLWVVLHIILLFVGDNFFDYHSSFYPLNGFDWFEAYDFTEFLFYFIVPVLLFFAYTLLINSDDFKRGYMDGMSDD